MPQNLYFRCLVLALIAIVACQAHAQFFKPIGPGDSVSGKAIPGQVNCITLDPADSQRMWAGTNGGLWFSSNGGQLWKKIDGDSLVMNAVSDICLVPGSKDSLYVVFGNRDHPHTGLELRYWFYSIYYNSDAGACYFTPDNGKSWKRVVVSYSDRSQNCIAPALGPSDRFIIGGDGGGGRGTAASGFSPVATNGVIYDIKRKPADPKVVYMSGIANVYKSTDSAKTFSTLNLKPTVPFSRAQLAVCPQAPNIVYALLSNQQGSFKGLHRSTDQGVTWELRSSSPNILCPYTTGFGFTGGGTNCLSLCVSPLDPDILYAGSLLIWRSTNGGKTWACVSDPNPHAANFVSPVVHQLKFSESQPSVVYAATNNGVFISRDSGMTWQSISLGIQAPYFNSLCASALSDSIIFCASPLGTFRNAKGVWSIVHDSSSTEVLSSRRTPSLVYTVSSYGYQILSTDSGRTFRENRSPNDCVPGVDAHPYYHSGVSPSLMFANLQKLFVSHDEGRHWAQLVHPFQASIIALALSDQDSNKVYALTSDNYIWRSTDAGVSWTSSPKLIPSTRVLRLCLRPNDDKAIVVYSSTDIFSSRDGGNSFARYDFLDYGIYTKPALDYIYWKRDECSEDVYAATNQGIYVCQWIDKLIVKEPVLNTIPAKDIRGMCISGREFYVATNGYGIWTSQLAEAAVRANILMSHDSVCTGEHVTFKDISEFTDGSSFWTFEGGYPSTSTEREVDIQFLSGGDHTIDLRVQGCAEDHIAQRTIHVFPRQKAKLALSSTQLCLGDTLTIQDISSMSFEQRSLVINGRDTLEFVGSRHKLICADVGTQTITLLRSNRCTKDSTTSGFVVLDVPTIPSIDKSGDTLRCRDTSLAAYQWYFNSKPISGATNSHYHVKVEGSYTLQVRNTAGCRSMSEVVYHSPKTSSVSADLTFGFLQVFPNPCTDLLNVQESIDLSKRSSGQKCSIEILSTLGKELQTFSLDETWTNSQITTSDLPSGSYILRVKCGAFIQMIHFIKL